MYYQFFMKTRTKNVLFFAKQTGSCKGKGYSLVKREQLGSRLGFIMLSAGCAIGCGNVWKFPWMCGQNGGGSFMLVYILCLILLGIPARVLEFSIGRAAQASPLFMYKKLEKPGQKWGIFGWFCLAGNIALMAFYTVVSGWIIYYFFRFLTGNHASLGFGAMISSPSVNVLFLLITLMTCYGQAPFVTVFMYLDEVPEGQTRKDLSMIIEEVLVQRMQGVKNEKGVWITPAFPKLIYVLDEDNISEDAPYWYLTELAAKCTAKRMVPDYISAKIMKELKQGDVYPCMGCRSFLTVEDSQRNADGSHKYYGRFNQGVVTINLVDVACSSEGDMDRFWEILDERLELCHEALRCRHERLLGTISDVAPILWQNGALARLKKGEKIDKLLFNGYSTISLGYAGLYEMCMRMLGKSHTDPEARPFALKVMQRLNDKCKEWKAAENISYSVYGTPMESTTYKFAKCLQKRFGIIPGVTDKNYITNSYHVHVSEKIDAFSKLKFESDFQKLSPGGAVSYVEVPNMQNNIPAVLSVMKFIYNNIMYAELNTKSDYCECCGYDGEMVIKEEESGKLIWECPNCGNKDQNKMFVARRTCGYIGTQFWNQGRTQEIRDRVLHL